jgi:hypothetical protein
MAAHAQEQQAERAGEQASRMPEARETRRSEEPPGPSLSPGERDRFERLLGHDLAGVKVHEDMRAAELADALGAEAFTVGRDIYVRTGGHRRGRERQRLLGHELAHVVQQARTGLALQPKLKITGTAADQARVAAPLNRGLFGRRVDIDRSTGNVTITTRGSPVPPKRPSRRWPTVSPR